MRATLQEILQEMCRLTSMSPEEDEYHLLWLEKDGQVPTIFSQTAPWLRQTEKKPQGIWRLMPFVSNQ